MPQDALSLRDIHLPPAVSWWPPALGWWVVLAVFLASSFALYYWYRRSRPSVNLRSVIQRDLLAIAAEYERSKNTQRLLAQLSSLLRQVAITYRGREGVAGVTGDAWLRSLDDLFKVSDFSMGVGKVLGFGPYTRQADVNGEELLRLCRRVMAELPPRIEAAKDQ